MADLLLALTRAADLADVQTEAPSVSASDSDKVRLVGQSTGGWVLCDHQPTYTITNNCYLETGFDGKMVSFSNRGNYNCLVN